MKSIHWIRSSNKNIASSFFSQDFKVMLCSWLLGHCLTKPINVIASNASKWTSEALTIQMWPLYMEFGLAFDHCLSASSCIQKGSHQRNGIWDRGTSEKDLQWGWRQSFAYSIASISRFKHFLFYHRDAVYLTEMLMCMNNFFSHWQFSLNLSLSKAIVTVFHGYYLFLPVI